VESLDNSVSDSILIGSNGISWGGGAEEGDASWLSVTGATLKPSSGLSDVGTQLASSGFGPDELGVLVFERSSRDSIRIGWNGAGSGISGVPGVVCRDEALLLV